MSNISSSPVSMSPSSGNFQNRQSFQKKVYLTPLQNFCASKQAVFFQKLKQREFNGQLIFQDYQGIASTFYFYLGRIVYATGGIHPARRWQRNLRHYCPQIAANTEILQQMYLAAAAKDSAIGCEYEILCELSRQQKILPEQLNQFIRSTIAEILFDLTQARQLSFYRKTTQYSSMPLTIINTESIIASVWQQWQEWQGAKLADRSPNSAPIIRSVEQLKSRTSPLTYQLLIQRLNGQNSLRDLAIQLNQDVLCLIRSLMPYVQLGFIDLISVPDFSLPFEDLIAPKSVASKQLLIAYGDESTHMCRRLELILNTSGYRFLGVQDGLQAISLFIEQKPDVIFLGSQLRHTDGYAMCHELRQFPVFQNTPIFMLTHNLSLVERIRAKMSGASEILEKPFNSETIYQTLGKYYQI